MHGWLLALAIVGLPALAGGYLLIKPDSGRSPVGGFTLLVIAAGITLAYVLFFPSDRFLSADFRIMMPIMLFGGAALGVVAGFLRR